MLVCGRCVRLAPLIVLLLKGRNALSAGVPLTGAEVLKLRGVVLVFVHGFFQVLHVNCKHVVGGSQEVDVLFCGAPTLLSRLIVGELGLKFV